MGGLTAAAILARSGVDVTVLEAHVYPGGCAGTFYHQGFRFDAGATLAAGFSPGGPFDLVARIGGIGRWPARPVDPALVAHLPDGRVVERVAGDRRWPIRKAAFGPEGVEFFRWQEALADAVWDLALRSPPWPPAGVAEAAHLAAGLRATLLRTGGLRRAGQLATAALRPLASYLPQENHALRQFIDSQLLISAQTTSAHAVALYAAAALDLPRRAAVSIEGGIGSIAAQLAAAVEAAGGRVLYRQRVRRIRLEAGRPAAVETTRGGSFPADEVIVNLPAPNVRQLLAPGEPAAQRLPTSPPADGWGAFMLYLGIDGGVVPPGLPLHHQLVARQAAAEGAGIFLSLSPEWDASRAPGGARAITISTHTARQPWWRLFESDRSAYHARIERYQERLLAGAERLLPGLQDALLLALPATPATFQHYTGRAGGWVGGFPQTSLLRARSPRLGRGLWMVGDAIFPGQSLPAVALGGLRVAAALLGELPSEASAGASLAGLQSAPAGQDA